MRKLLALGLGASLLVVGTGAVLAQNTPSSAPAANPRPRPPLRPRPRRPRASRRRSVVTASSTRCSRTSSPTGRSTSSRRTPSRPSSRRSVTRSALTSRRRPRPPEGPPADPRLPRGRRHHRRRACAAPADNPLRNLDKFLEDGKMTSDELRQLGVGRGGKLGFGHGHGPKQQEGTRRRHRRHPPTDRGPDPRRALTAPCASGAAPPTSAKSPPTATRAFAVAAARRPAPGPPVGDRERHREGRATARRRAMDDRPAVRLHDRRRDRQPKPAPAAVPRAPGSAR